MLKFSIFLLFGHFSRLPFLYRALYRQNASRNIVFVANYFGKSSVANLVLMHKVFKVVELLATVVI